MSAQPAYQAPASAPKTADFMSMVYSEADYLAFDEAAEGRWEFMDGRIIPVGAPELANQLDPALRAGATPNHYRLSRTLAGLFYNRLRASCEAYTSDARTYTPVSTTYSYPDLVAVCGPPEYHAPKATLPSLTNPMLIVEIVSASTGNYDRSGKFLRYLSIESLQHYLLVDSRQMQVELYTRLPAGTWEYWHGSAPADVIDLKSVGCQLTLGELYAQIDFDDPAAAI